MEVIYNFIHENLGFLMNLQILNALELGLIYSLVAIGVYISFRVIDFPDLTVDGSFPLGAAVSAIMIINLCNPLYALICSFIAGVLAGIVTSLLHVKGRIIELLASIIVMSALYSINLRIMGQPNIALIGANTIFTTTTPLLLLIIINIAIFILLNYILNSELGLAIRASGINSKSSLAQGVNVSLMKVIALSLSNGLIALAGGIFAQSQGFADISMGTGTIIVGLASVIIGEKIIKSNKVKYSIIAAILGSVAYRLCITGALNADFLGLEASDLNLVTSIIVAVIMISPAICSRRKI